MRRPLLSPQIEPLEARIAPSVIILGAGTTTNNQLKYSDTSAINPKTGHPYLQFFDTDPSSSFYTNNPSHETLSGANLAIAEAIGSSTPSNEQSYFIKVGPGEIVEIATPVGYQQLVNVTKGTVVAVFTDVENGGVVNADDLTGLALGNKTAVSIGDGIFSYPNPLPATPDTLSNGPFYGGFIVTNYNDLTGTLGGATESAGHATQLLPNTVLSLNVAGPIQGGFIAGAAVTKLTATGSVAEILTGNAANGVTFSFEGAPNTTGNTTLSIPIPATGVKGPSIASALIGSMTTPDTIANPTGGPGLIQMGGGGPGAAGGSIGSLTILGQASGMTALGGLGGAGGAVKTSGGAGGSLSNVVFLSPSTMIAGTANEPIVVMGGAGGAGSAHGGAGGAVTGVFVDYASTAQSTVGAPNLINDVTVQGGAGGAGATGGAGGKLSNINVITSTPHAAASITPEVQLIGGAGGNSATGGRGGAGGSITNAQVIDDALPGGPGPLPDDTGATSPTSELALIQGGGGGTDAVKGAGGAGGLITGLTLEGFNFQISSGIGGSGVSAGGAGGSIGTVDILGSTGSLPGDAYHAESVVLTTGNGGNGSAGKGGAGGSLNFVTIQNADFGQVNPEQKADYGATSGFEISTGFGGLGGKGAGGAGGSITNVKVTDSDFLTVSHPLGNFGTASITTGYGGASPGSNGKGGAGGSMTSVTLVGTRLNISGGGGVSTGYGGAGGVGALSGKGGAGGSMTSVAIRTAEGFNPSTTTASTGLLLDSGANFINDGVQVGDTVMNALTFATTTVTTVTATELGLNSDIFATGDPYQVIIPGASQQTFSGFAMDSQNTIIDANANFLTDGVTKNDVIQDITDTNFNNGVPVTTVVTQVLSATELQVSSDISHVGDQYEITTLTAVTMAAGYGGAGVLKGAGGAGGSITDSNAVSPGAVSITGGAGGAGGSAGAAGAGGTLNGDAAFSTYAAGLMQAGNAGTGTGLVGVGAKAGAGGSIIGANIEALTNVSLMAGFGTAGGAGGNVSSSGFSGVLQSGGGFNPPAGNVTVQAGAGGTSATGNGGAGGSISTLTGFISTGDGVDPFITQFDGGAGGNGVKVAGAGGSVDNIRFFGGGGVGVTFFINAGDAGNASTGKTGATGGSVNNIGGGTFATGTPDPNFAVNASTDFHHISAGNGGNATTKGGLGGSVNNVFVNASIGQRTGAMFGFDIAGQFGAVVTGAGGISAGAGGTGAVTAGLAGNVTNISADAIASIVAGHLHVGDPLLKSNLANKVSGIILNGSTANAPSLVQEFTLTFNGQTTASLPTNASTTEVAAALNGLSSIGGRVTVAPGPNGGYIVTFITTGAQVAITGAESTAVPDGTTTEVVNGVTQVTDGMGNIITPGVDEVQNVQVNLNPFYLSFTAGGVTEQTTVLPPNATPAQVAAALNALPNIQGVGDVTVTTGKGNSNAGYNVTFGSFGPQQPILATYSPYNTELVAGNTLTSTDEVQQLQVLPADPFTLSFQGQTTTQLAASDTATDVQNALNALTNIQNAGGVDVTSVVVPGNPNTFYDVTFQAPGQQALIIPNFTLGVAQTVTGGPGVSSVQTITLAARGDFSPPQFSAASLVGSIYDILQTNASTFHYTPLIAPTSSFQFGDVPIDGMIAAADLVSSKNFVPEAYITADGGGNAVLVDNVNS